MQMKVTLKLENEFSYRLHCHESLLCTGKQNLNFRTQDCNLLYKQNFDALISDYRRIAPMETRSVTGFARNYPLCLLYQFKFNISKQDGLIHIFQKSRLFASGSEQRCKAVNRIIWISDSQIDSQIFYSRSFLFASHECQTRN